MGHLNITPAFLKDSLKLLREKGLKETVFGNTVKLEASEQELLEWIEKNPSEFKKLGGRKGNFIKIDLVHKGSGLVYLLENTLGDRAHESVVIFDNNIVIQPGPDLYIYLSTEANIKDNGLGEYLDLGLIKGTKGGQLYTIEKPVKTLQKYRSAVIYCKQFSVLFTFATLE